MNTHGPHDRADGTKGYYCEFPKCGQECDHLYRYCSYHRCRMPLDETPAGCGGKRSTNPVGGTFTLCADHRCRDLTCGAAAWLPQSEHCRDHTCQATTSCREGCARTVTLRVLSRYCAAHKCSHGECAELRATTLLPDPLDPTQYRPDGSTMGYGYRYWCPGHSCSVEDCVDRPPDRGPGAGSGYCLRHVVAWQNMDVVDH